MVAQFVLLNPPLHVTHDPAPGADHEPTAHVKHVEAADVVEYVPAAHT